MTDLLIFRVSETEIKNLDAHRLQSALERCMEVNLRGEVELNTLMLTTDAYDDDPRALYDIPEMRQWCEHVGINTVQLFLVLDSSSVNWFFPAVAPINIVNRTSTNTDYTFVQPQTDKLVDELEQRLRNYLATITSGESEIAQVFEKSSLKSIRVAVHRCR